MNFDPRLLSGIGVLIAVVESGNFARAGESLSLTPSGVSRAIARLETRVGIRLLHRTTRAVKLTDEGARFYAQVAPLLSGIEDAAADAAGATQAVRGRLRVNLDTLVSRLVLAPRLPALLARHPELELELLTRDELGDLVSEGIDVALRFGTPVASSLVARQMLQTRVLTVAAPSYLARRGTPKHPRDLPQHDCLRFRDPLNGRPFQWEFHRKGKVLPVDAGGPVLFNDTATMHAACLAGAGIAQVLALGVEELLRSGRLVELFPDWPGETFPLYAYYPTRRHTPAKVRAFIDFCLDALVESEESASSRAAGR
ncbi:MAG: LysR family transcriptional regulator [Dyella sp.]